MKCYLRFENDTPEEAQFFPSVAAAKREYSRTARQLDRFGQAIQATLHIVDSRESAPAEYPDYVLSLESGYVKQEAA